MIPVYIMSFYSSRMLTRSLAAQTPVREKRQKKNDKTSSLNHQTVLTKAESVGLAQGDIAALHKQVERMSCVKNFPWKTIFHCDLFCKKTNETKLVERANNLYEKGLDIRSFIQVRTKQSLLLRTIFNQQQKLLFKYNHYISLA